jgi:hypothetical protein
MSTCTAQDLEVLASHAAAMAYPLAAPASSSGSSGGGAKRANAYQDIFGRPQQQASRVLTQPSPPPPPAPVAPYYAQQHLLNGPQPRLYHRHSYIAPQPGQPYYDPYYSPSPQPSFNASYPSQPPAPPPPPVPPAGLPYYPPKPPSLHMQPDDPPPASQRSPTASFDCPPSPQSLLHDPGLQQYLANSDNREPRDPSPDINEAYWDGFQEQAGVSDGEAHVFFRLVAALTSMAAQRIVL